MKLMKAKIITGSIPFVLIIVLLHFIYILTPSVRYKTDIITAKNGKVDFSQMDSSKVYSLSGEWNFTPSQFYSLYNIVNPDTYAHLPGRLSSTVLASEYGYASYGLHITGLKTDVVYGIHINYVMSACTVSVNGQDVASQGQPGLSKVTEYPEVKSTQAFFKSRPDGTADIIFNISNFHDGASGIAQPILIGSAKKIVEGYQADLMLNMVLFAIILVIALLLIVFGIFYRQANWIIWFSIACIFVSIRSLCFYPHAIAFLTNEAPWFIIFILRYITYPLPFLFFTIFQKKIFNLYFKIPYYTIIGVLTLYAVGTILLPTGLLMQIQPYVLAASFLLALYNITILILACFKKKYFVFGVLPATFPLVFFWIYDSLITLGIIKGSLLINVGTALTVFITTIMLLYFYILSIKRIEDLTAEKKFTNQSLKRFVPSNLINLLHKDSIVDVIPGDSVDLQMTVFSIDIRSFTSTSEKLQPDQIFNLLNRYFAIVAPIVRKHNGIITKYLGDGFIALFSGGADDALQCGIDIQNILKRKHISANGLPPIRIGIGIDRGDLLLGTIGDFTRMDSIIISNSYYTAETLQQTTKTYVSSIIISEAVFANLQDPASYLIRPIKKIVTDNRLENFLFEVYDCDDEKIVNLKYKAQPYMEHAIQAFIQRKIPEAFSFINKALNIFPNDPVAQYYKAVIEKNLHS